MTPNRSQDVDDRFTVFPIVVLVTNKKEDPSPFRQSTLFFCQSWDREIAHIKRRVAHFLNRMNMVVAPAPVQGDSLVVRERGTRTMGNCPCCGKVSLNGPSTTGFSWLEMKNKVVIPFTKPWW